MRGGGCGRLLGEGERWMVAWFERGGGEWGFVGYGEVGRLGGIDF